MFRTNSVITTLAKKIIHNLAFSSSIDEPKSVSERPKVDIDQLFLQIDIRIGRIVEC